MKKLLSVLVVFGFLMSSRPALALADDAEAIYKSKCQVCHGPDGKGSAAGQKIGVKDFHSPEIQKMSDDELFNATKQGKGKMPAYDKKLTDDQIKQLIQYIRSLK